LADDVEKDFPKASNMVRHFMYVDDVLAGANSIQEAQLAISELHHAFNRAGFPVRKLTANQESILEDIPNENLLHNDFRDLNSESLAKRLGVRWNATSDEFYFVPPPVSIESTYTKREVLSQIANHFDPAGWLSPFIVRSKIFMQEIWLQVLGWDENIPTKINQRWQEFLRSSSELEQIRIPRWVGFQQRWR